jgi:uncharacterized membrane protein
MRQTRPTTHRILALILFSSILSGFRFVPIAEPPAAFYTTRTLTDTKTPALEVLKTRCNMRHVKQNPAKVFTTANMNLFAADINEQVFIKKRMPRGNRVRLTNDEYNTLKNWLITQIPAN